MFASRQRKLLVILVAALAGVVATEPASASECRARRYAVYLSPHYEKGVRWGGYHVTLTGFSANHVCHGSMEAVLRKAWHEANGGKPFSFDSKIYKKDYREHSFQYPEGKRWGISFNSGMLSNTLIPLLKKGGFEMLKSQWHISLYSNSAHDAVVMFDSHLKHKPWQLYLVPMPDK
ncbi:MAG TPA: hypothetical protein PKE16_18095, partial [Hyphomicrobium sp.]|nr:hypothetical protein [Hyphomicrobium sp.]